MAEMLEGSQVLMGLFDEHDRLQHANAAFLHAYHIRLENHPSWTALLRDNHAHRRGVVVEAPDFEGWLASAKSRRAQQPFRAFETNLWDGRWLWMTETLRSNGWMLCIATDITQLKASEHAMRHARDQAVAVAHTDALTGIGNRRHVLGQLAEMLGALRTPSDLLSVVVADLDRYTSIQDRFGSPAIDAVLRDFAARSQHLVQPLGTVGRVRGEEFMLLLPACDATRAEQLMAQLHDQVRQAHPLPAWPGFGYTFSAGIARARLGDSAEQVFRRANLALYQAKQAGCNASVRAAD